MTLPITVSETRLINFNKNVQTSFSAQESPTNTTGTYIRRKTFFVEGSVPSEAIETPETIDMEDYVFSANSNFPQTDARFVSQRPYNLRRGDHLAMPRALGILQPICLRRRFSSDCDHLLHTQSFPRA